MEEFIFDPTENCFVHISITNINNITINHNGERNVQVNKSQTSKHQQKYKHLVRLLYEDLKEDCCVCLTKQTNYRTLCKHSICRNCAEYWNRKSNNKFICPTCRLTPQDLLNQHKQNLLLKKNLK